MLMLKECYLGFCRLKTNHRTDSCGMFLDSVGALLFFLNSKASQFQVNNSNVGG